MCVAWQTARVQLCMVACSVWCFMAGWPRQMLASQLGCAASSHVKLHAPGCTAAHYDRVAQVSATLLLLLAWRCLQLLSLCTEQQGTA
jgi:hypothetical protein